MPKPTDPKKIHRQSLYRSSPRVLAVLARLQYIGEHVFSGNIKAYAKTIGMPSDKLWRLLNGEGRFNLAMFLRFVESGIASAEWMFCGTGHMHARPDKLDDLSGYISSSIKSRYPIFDVFSAVPIRPTKAKKFFAGKSVPSLVKACLPAARQLLEAHAASNPVTLFIDDSVLRAGATNVILDLMRRKYVTSIAMSFSAAVLDYYAAKKIDYEPAELQSAIFAASRAGLGVGEGIGALGFFKADNRARSIMATGYDLGIPVTVHTAIGADLMHTAPALCGSEYGAALGATSYVDLLVFIKHLQPTNPAKRSLFIVSGQDSVLALQLEQTAIRASCASAVIDFSQLRNAWLSDAIPDADFDLRSVSAPFAELLPSFLTACDFVYKGEPRDHHIHTKPRKSKSS